MKIAAITSCAVMLFLIDAVNAQNYQCPATAELKEIAECIPKYGLLVYSSGKFVSSEVKCAIPGGKPIAVIKQNSVGNWYMISFSDNTYGYIPRQDDDGGSIVSGSCGKELPVGATN